MTQLRSSLGCEVSSPKILDVRAFFSRTDWMKDIYTLERKHLLSSHDESVEHSHRLLLRGSRSRLNWIVTAGCFEKGMIFFGF